MENEKQKPEGSEQTAESPQKSPENSKKHEIGGRGGLDPARFGDWEINGKCVDF